MKFIHYSLGLVFVLFSCKTIDKTTSKQESQRVVEEVELTAAQQRKFDYFFYEASREKMKGNLEKSAMYIGECLKIDPSSSASMYELSNILVAGNEPLKAQKVLERAVQITPDNLWYNMLLADLYQNNKLPHRAISIYEKFVKSDNENIEYRYSLAQLYAQNKEYSKALDQYDLLERQLGINEIIVLDKEKIYVELGKNKQALNELSKLTNKFPHEARYYGYIADYYLFENDFQNAKLYYNRVLEKDPKYSLAYFSLGNVALAEKDTSVFVDNYLKALNSNTLDFNTKFQRLVPFLSQVTTNQFNATYLDSFFKSLVESHPDEADAYIYYGSYLKIIQENQAAIDHFKKALSISNGDETVWQEYLLLLADYKDFDGMYQESLRAIELYPKTSFFYLLAGSSGMQLEKFEEALKLFETGVEHVGENKALKAQFFANLGDVNYSLDNSKDAFYYFEESLAIDELNIVVLNNYSYYLSVENKDLDKAEKMSSKCVEMEPGNSTYLDTYAWVLFKRERFTEAKFIIERAIDNGGNESDVIVEHYGDILYKIGDVEGAMQYWKQSLELGNPSETLPQKIEQRRYIE